MSILENVSNFDPSQGKILDTEIRSVCQMEVRELGDIRWIVSQDGVLHGAMSRSQPNKPILPYVRAMLSAQFIMPSAKTVLNLGLGAGAIERYLSEAFPRIKVTSVEISQERLDQASHYFGIPGSCNIIIQDALTFLQQGTLEQDIIYCDLFDIRNNFNKPLTNTFIHCLWKGLANSGIAVINYAFEAQDKLIGTLVELRKIFTTTAVLEVKDHTNIILFAVKGDIPEQELIGKSAAQFKDVYNLQFKKTLDTITWLPSHFDR